MYNELESQNDEQVGQMTEKVKMLKSVSLPLPYAGGEERVCLGQEC